MRVAHGSSTWVHRVKTERLPPRTKSPPPRVLSTGSCPLRGVARVDARTHARSDERAVESGARTLATDAWVALRQPTFRRRRRRPAALRGAPRASRPSDALRGRRRRFCSELFSTFLF